MSLTRELVRNAEFQAPPRTFWFRIHILRRSQCPLNLLIMFSSAEGKADSNHQEGPGALCDLWIYQEDVPIKWVGSRMWHSPWHSALDRSAPSQSQAGVSQGFFKLLTWLQSNRCGGTRKWNGWPPARQACSHLPLPAPLPCLWAMEALVCALHRLSSSQVPGKAGLMPWDSHFPVPWHIIKPSYCDVRGSGFPSAVGSWL